MGHADAIERTIPPLSYLCGSANVIVSDVNRGAVTRTADIVNGELSRSRMASGNRSVRTSALCAKACS